jgi:hypothetical protein
VNGLSKTTYRDPDPTESVDAKRVRPKTEKLAPNRAKARKDREDPS